MYEETKSFLKITGVILIASIISGIAGGVIGGCVSAKMHKKVVKKMFLEHCPKRNFDEGEYSRYDIGQRRIRRWETPEVEGVFEQEDYILVPKDLIKAISKEAGGIKPFDGPRPNRERHGN